MTEKLNALGVAWFEAKEAGNEQKQMALQIDIFELAIGKNGKFEKCKDEIGDYFLKRFPNFDPSKSSLTSHMSKQLGYSKKDMHRKDTGMHKVTVTEEDDEGNLVKDRYYVSNQSLDVPVNHDESDGATKQDMIEDTRPVVAQDAIQHDETFLQIVSLMLGLQNHLVGGKNNPVKIKYYRMFYADGIVNYLSGVGQHALLLAHERDIFATMHLPFLDFFMEDICREIITILRSQVKVHGAMVEGKPMDTRPNQPLPADVYKGYFRRIEEVSVSDGAISQQRKSYRTLQTQLESGAPC